MVERAPDKREVGSSILPRPTRDSYKCKVASSKFKAVKRVPRIERFEDIKSWQLAKALVKDIYELAGQASFSKDYSLRDQIQRAAVSIMSNIAEGFERGSKKDFVNFLYIARGSCAEVRSLLYVAFELGYISESRFQQALHQTEEISKAIFGFIRYLKTEAP